MTSLESRGRACSAANIFRKGCLQSNRMGGQMRYLTADNRDFLLALEGTGVTR
jgi:hypothetical protein